MRTAGSCRSRFGLLALILSVAFSRPQAVDSLKSCKSADFPRKASCGYGVLPGRWLLGAEGLSWNLHDPGCQLQNLLGSFPASVPDPSTLGGEVGILLLGDSVERYIVTDMSVFNRTFCLKTSGPWQASLMPCGPQLLGVGGGRE